MKQVVKEKRSTVLPVIRVSPSEKEAIKKAYLASSYANQSTFIRSTLLEKSSLTVNEKRLQAELTAGKIYKETTKIEAQILKMVQELKIKEGGQLNKKHLLPYAKLLQSIKIIKAQLNEED